MNALIDWGSVIVVKGCCRASSYHSSFGVLVVVVVVVWLTHVSEDVVVVVVVVIAKVAACDCVCTRARGAGLSGRSRMRMTRPADEDNTKLPCQSAAAAATKTQKRPRFEERNQSRRKKAVIERCNGGKESVLVDLLVNNCRNNNETTRLATDFFRGGEASRVYP